MIYVIGEVMLDKYVFGDVNRISPEAPVPVLHIHSVKFKLGGAGNVAQNIVNMGEKARVITVMGKDTNSQKVIELSQKAGIELIPLFDNNRPTIVKERFIAIEYMQQLLRVDTESKKSIKKDIEDEIIKNIRQINKDDIVIISDYGKGMITKKIVDSILERSNLVLVDPKPKNIQLYKNSFLVKPNYHELIEIFNKKDILTDKEIEELTKRLSELLNSNVVVTLGDRGALLVKKNGETKRYYSKKHEVKDVTGAGDTFIATVAVALKRGYTIEEAINLGNIAAGISVTKFGTTSINWEAIINAKDI